MVIDFLLGISICVISYYSFLLLKYPKSLTDWIFEISKFVYLIGHPTLTEDQIHERIKIRFRAVATSFAIVLLKTLCFLLILMALLFVSDYLSSSIAEGSSVSFERYTGDKFWTLSILTNYAFLAGTLFPIILIPLVKRPKKENRSDYSIIDKFLHYVFIGNKNVAKFLFRMEQFVRKKEIISNKQDKNVYISGLARAGTTILMQYLGQVDNFRSISYRNLPFLFLPKTGLKFSGSNEITAKERFHKDGLEHSLSSYEALEEPFWRNFNGPEYISEKSLKQHSLDASVYSKYCDFRKLIADGHIYLAKNNNHLLRAKSLVKQDGIVGISTSTIIPFRNPVDHAKSLLKQHKLLKEEQEKDEFVRDYMDFLVHNEFGQGVKLQLFQNDSERESEYDQDEINYWLEIWYSYYQSVKEQFENENGFAFFCYESFVSHPKESLEKIFEYLEMPTDLVNGIKFKRFTQKNTIEEYISENDDMDWAKFIGLYKELRTISINK